MANSLYQQMTASQQSPNNMPQMGQIKHMADMLKNSSNPISMLQSMCQQNPKMGMVMNMLNGSKLTPKQLFMQYAQQNGIDPNQIINQLK